MKYDVYSTGNALFSQYEDPKGKAIFDIGYSEPELWAGVINSLYTEPVDLVISHYHLDHYNGLKDLKGKNLQIKNLYLPAIPQNSLHKEAIMAFMTIQLVKLGKETGLYYYSLIDLVKEILPGFYPLKTHLLTGGDQFPIGNSVFHVLWPQPNIYLKESKLKRALAKFGKILEHNDHLKSFYESVKYSNQFDENRKEVFNEPVHIQIDKKTIEKLKEVGKVLEYAANRLSLAFHCPKTLLFLGDLDYWALNKVFPDLAINNPKHEIVLSAHHGTHFSNNGTHSGLESVCTVHANGKKMFKHFMPEYLSFGKYHHCTYIHGDFNSEQCLRLIKLVKLHKDMSADQLTVF